MVGHLNVRLLVCVALVSLTALWGASVAAANSATGTQDPGATVAASLLSSGFDPEFAKAGDTINASFTLTSNMVDKSGIRLIVGWTWVGTGPSWDISKLVTFQPGKTWGHSHRFEVKGDTPPGTYQLRVVAATPFAIEPLLLPSVAEATITVN